MSAADTPSSSKPSKSSAIAREVCETLYTGRQVEPFSKRVEGFDNVMAYRAIAKLRALRLARG